MAVASEVSGRVGSELVGLLKAFISLPTRRLGLLVDDCDTEGAEDLDTLANKAAFLAAILC